ncbi:NAD-dependent epimerase/dehydratase family protein [Hydrogenophaga flava]|uniref:NAD-dependent epimerase/dehydratase family protein n=1 Tax=Hydrogenophaga flava TaxID=65657 RepID=UPI00082516BB|nr:NAD-dependent epimerase/dehydratase family protein [Hydrogenophaga flava]
MRILLTGASGFTGRHFQQVATGYGHEAVDLSIDLTDASAVARAVERAGPCDALVHLAAISFVGHADESAFYAVNTVGTTNLLRAFDALSVTSRPRKLLIASSANVYGNCPQSPITETQSPAPVNHYAASKLAMEQMAMTFADRLPIVITRPFNYTGPGQAPSFLIPKLVDHFARRAPAIELGNLHVEREFNDVRMVCEAYLRLLDDGESGQIYNVCTGTVFSLQQVLDMLGAITGHDIDVRVNPAFVRASEVHQLCGAPEKLINCIGPLPAYPLSNCLSVMLQAHAAQTQSAPR